MLRPFMHHLERRLHARDMDARTSHPFDWGLSFLDRVPEPGGDPLAALRAYNAESVAESARYFAPAPAEAGSFAFDGHNLRFPSGIATPYEKNNRVHARYFPAEGAQCAVIVSPQWNAQPDSHVGLCEALRRYGKVSALRLSLPYHDERMLEGFSRADFMVSANLGRTLQAVRQSVHDIRRTADWLFLQGYRRVGVMGTSIGSCVSWLAFIHDERLEAGVFNMVSSWFGDVVWRALTTTHIRRALEPHLSPEDLRDVWRVNSPSAHAPRLARVRRRALCISTRYDLTFLPDLARIFHDDCDRHGVPAEKVFLPCGHYTIGRTPFKYLDAYHIVNFFRRL